MVEKLFVCGKNTKNQRICQTYGAEMPSYADKMASYAHKMAGYGANCLQIPGFFRNFAAHMDKISAEQRHNNMAAIRGKDTKPEMVVRRWLWGHGFRYRLNHPRLPGKPDIVMRKYRTCIFVNGCFWHGHHVELPCGEWTAEAQGEDSEAGDSFMHASSEAASLMEIENSECCKIPRSNREFWVKKIRRNKARDVEVQRKLAAMGWHSITIWECELKPKVREQTLKGLAYTLNRIFLQDCSLREYKVIEEEGLKAAEDLGRE